MRLGTADVLVRAKTGQYKKDLKKAENETESFGKSAIVSIGKVSASMVAMGGVAATALAYASIKMLDYGSDLQETQGKFDVVFRGMGATSEAWAESLQDDYAMAETESKKYLSSIQDLLVPTGMMRGEAGKLSNAFVKMAADLGSFNNRETVEVVRDIQSALQGSSETMAKYGINVKAAKVEAEIFRTGMASTKSEITDAHKAQAIYNIMMREGSDAVGDMARTSDSYANQLKKAEANVTDLKTTIGEGLLPVASDMISDFNEWFKVNKNLIEQDLPKYIYGVTEALKGTAKTIKTITNFIIESQSDYDKMFENFVKWGLVMDPKKMEEYVKKFEDLAKAPGPVLHAIDKTTEGFERYNKAGGDTTETNDVVGDSFKKLSKEAQNAKDSLEAIRVDLDLEYFYKDIDKAEDSYRRSLQTANNIEIQNGADDNYDLDSGYQDDGLAEQQADQDRRLALLAEFNMEHKQTTMTTMAFELDQLNQQYDEYAKVVDDKVQLDEWYAEKTKQITEDTTDIWGDAFSGWATSYASTLNDMLWDSELTFEGILESFGKMITQMIIQQSMLQAADWGGSLLSNIGGMALGAISGIGGGLGGGAAAGATTLSNGAVMNAGGSVFGMADGGMINEHVKGIGMSSGASYEFGEGGVPEAVLPSKYFGGRNGQGGSTPDPAPVITPAPVVVPAPIVKPQIINVSSEKEAEDYINSGRADTVIINRLQKNKAALQGIFA